MYQLFTRQLLCVTEICDHRYKIRKGIPENFLDEYYEVTIVPVRTFRNQKLLTPSDSFSYIFMTKNLMESVK